ncbi:MAG: galactokinase family protein [Candidatus Enteromonas sp.]|nr:galactokinase family protein [Candidatus Enteromonas sp.]
MIRLSDAKALFSASFPQEKNPRVVYSHGRMEILGNHTDHNHGLCLVAGVDLGITAAVSPRNDGEVHIVSEGYRPFSFSILDLTNNPRERSTTLGLTKGVLSGMKKLGYKIGGFTAALVSDIPSGSGVSSSACYESLIVKIVDFLYNNNIVLPLAMAKIGQYAENVYFGKPCGLLDQIGTSFGGTCFLDFHDPKDIAIETISWTLPLDITLVLTPSSHAGLDSLYAAIPQDMKSVAKNLFQKEVLGDVDEATFGQTIVLPSAGVSERAKLRAQHFFDENHRVESAYEAIKTHNPASFLHAVEYSQFSSASLLANTMIPGHYANSPQEAVDSAVNGLKIGKARIMGGGFAGSIIVFTPASETSALREKMGEKYGAKNVIPATIVDGGPRLVGE